MVYQVATSPGLIGGSGPFIPPESGGAPQKRPMPGPGFQLPQGGRAGMSDLLAGGGIDGLLERLQGQLGGTSPKDGFFDGGPISVSGGPAAANGGALGGGIPTAQTLPAVPSGADGRMQSISMPFKPAPVEPSAPAPPNTQTTSATPPAAEAPPAPAVTKPVARPQPGRPLPGSNADFAALATPPGRPKPMPQVTMPASPAPDPWGDLAGTNFAKRAQKQGFKDLAGYEKFRETRGGGGLLSQMYDKARGGGSAVTEPVPLAGVPAPADLAAAASSVKKPIAAPLGPAPAPMFKKPMPAPAPTFAKPLKMAPVPAGNLDILTTKPAGKPAGAEAGAHGAPDLRSLAGETMGYQDYKDPAAVFQGSPAGQNFLKRLQSLGVADIEEGVRLAKQRPDSVLGRMYANASKGMPIAL